MPQAHRYALYLAPVGSWRDIGRRWLGRCEETGVAPPPPPGTGAGPPDWTAAPRRYGLHATLKPPFRLRAGATAEELDRAVRAFAAGCVPFDIPLRRERLRDFLAWCIGPDEIARRRMNALAAAAVRELDHFRAPPTPTELARRQAQALTPTQRDMLARWGYPYVLDTFTFHITLTGMLAPAEVEAADAQLARLDDAGLRRPMPVRAVSLYVEPEPDADFIVARHYGFDGQTRDGAGAVWLQSTSA